MGSRISCPVLHYVYVHSLASQSPVLGHLSHFQYFANTNRAAVNNFVHMDFHIVGDLFTDAAETEKMAKSLEDSEGVCFVPSFSGLQAPLNDPCACASFMGLKASTNKYHLVRAILESIAFRNKQLYELMQKEIHIPVTKVRADGGVCKNNFVMQMTSDLINVNIERPINLDMSCLGAAFLAGLAVGFWTDKEELKKLRQSEVVFKPWKTGSKQ